MKQNLLFILDLYQVKGIYYYFFSEDIPMVDQLKAIQEVLLERMEISGVKGIKKVYISEKKFKKFEPKIGFRELKYIF